MAAWTHRRYWTPRVYDKEYRDFVVQRAPKYRGRMDYDCADLTLLVLIEFAVQQGLPVTFWDNDQVRYPSKGSRQTPSALVLNRTWNTADEYIKAVTDRIQSKSLVNQNTVVNRLGPQPGDLMVKTDHTALVVAVYGVGVSHPKAYDKSIPTFPGHEQARLQMGQTEYFRAATPTATSEINSETHFDYLNHRGFGKERAELIYYTRVSEMRAQGFDFRQYKDGVLDNWPDWNGTGDPPR